MRVKGAGPGCRLLGHGKFQSVDAHMPTEIAVFSKQDLSELFGGEICSFFLSDALSIRTEMCPIHTRVFFLYV